ncbi:MAG: hypothetical protein ABR587_05450 [Candidatus Binatia bacterium]
MMKAGGKLDSARSKHALACIKSFAKGTLVGSVESCLPFDEKMKISQATEAVIQAAVDNCGIPLPPFGIFSPSRLLNGVDRARTAVPHDAFSYDLASGLVPCSTNADTCSCQAKVAKAVEKHASTSFKMFLACNKKNLSVATTQEELNECVDDPLNLASLAADDKGKIAKSRQKLQDTITKRCTEPGVSLATAFPGACAASPDAASLATCLDRQVDCRVCTEANEMQGLDVDCDVYDDGMDNGSCVLLFQPTQRIDGNNVTCSSVENTGTYTQCNDFQIFGTYMLNDAGCPNDWSSTNTEVTDNLGLCQSLGAASMEAFYSCTLIMNRYIWQDHTWSNGSVGGYTRHLRCHF